ncbi:hypothetical protein MN116_003983 [Schistosoma mekongi]|uniref:Uncharacterized protein n=1 Tax=Schistosoma mekongi TaxID=38744 RepID=A0AAE1ZED6_SCHME|nr:hypothetical protein MN116_003983 [Schistosoma mekongi]
MKIASLLQHKINCFERLTSAIYKLIVLYSNGGRECICSNIEVQTDSDYIVNTCSTDSDSVIMREVEEALKKAQLALSPQCKVKPDTLIIPSKSVSKSEHTNICTKQLPSNIHGSVTKLRQYAPAHYKAPYRTDMHISKRRKIGRLIQSTQSRSTVKENKNVGQKTIKMVGGNISRQEDSLTFSRFQNINLYHSVAICDSHLSQKHQQAVLTEKLGQSVLCLRLLISRVRQTPGCNNESTLRFYENVTVESKLVSRIYLAIQRCELTSVLFSKFSSLVQFIDIQEASSDEISWIQHVLSRFTRILNLLKLLLIKANRESNDLFSPIDALHDPLTDGDPISEWFASKWSVKLINSPSPYEAYLTIGNCISGSGASRLLALTLYPEMCIFNGSEEQILLFTNLWSELESIQTELELLNTFKTNLPDLVDDLFTKTVNRASVFRNLYTLVCGNSPSILKSIL